MMNPVARLSTATISVRLGSSRQDGCAVSTTGGNIDVSALAHLLSAPLRRRLLSPPPQPCGGHSWAQRLAIASHALHAIAGRDVAIVVEAAQLSVIARSSSGHQPSSREGPTSVSSCHHQSLAVLG